MKREEGGGKRGREGGGVGERRNLYVLSLSGECKKEEGNRWMRRIHKGFISLLEGSEFTQVEDVSGKSRNTAHPTTNIPFVDPNLHWLTPTNQWSHCIIQLMTWFSSICASSLSASSRRIMAADPVTLRDCCLNRTTSSCT